MPNSIALVLLVVKAQSYPNTGQDAVLSVINN